MLTTIEQLIFMIGPQTHPFCGPIFFARSLKSAIGNVTANGSFGLVDTGRKKLLVTCHHVWKAFQDSRCEDSELRMLVCLDKNAPVTLEPSLYLCGDEAHDLATFDMEPLLWACGGRAFYPLNRSPSPKVKKGDRLYFQGYPGQFRSTTTEGIEFGSLQYLVSVSDVSGTKFVADLSKASTEFARQPQQPPASTPHGGISGAPCFLMHRNRAPQLAGFVTSECLGLLKFTHVDCLLAA